MSEIKTRIENATAELATATQTIHDLPDYPDLKDGVEIFDITGTYKPELNIYTQTTEPTSK